MWIAGVPIIYFSQSLVKICRGAVQKFFLTRNINYEKACPSHHSYYCSFFFVIEARTWISCFSCCQGDESGEPCSFARVSYLSEKSYTFWHICLVKFCMFKVDWNTTKLHLFEVDHGWCSDFLFYKVILVSWNLSKVDTIRAANISVHLNRDTMFRGQLFVL